MKTRNDRNGAYIVIGWFALFLMVMASQGCESSQTRWAMARQSHTQTEKALVTANTNGWLSDKSFVATERYVDASEIAVAQAKTLIQPDGSAPKTFDAYLDLVESTLRQLKQFTEGSVK